MSSIRTAYMDDPFEHYYNLIEKLNKIYDITESTFFTLAFSKSVRNQFAQDTVISSPTALSAVINNLNQNNILGNISSAFDVIASKGLASMSAIGNINSVLQKLAVSNIASLSFADALEYKNSIETVIPVVIDAIEEAEEDTILETEIATEENKQKQQKISTSLLLEYLKVLVAVLQILTNIFFHDIPDITFNINITNDYSTNYYIQEVQNQYVNYVTNGNITINESICFVAEKEVKPRIKPDCSSQVIEKLPLGKIVKVVEKYKKWVHICWLNEDGTHLYGWVQNYKLREFKE
ncbi:MAG: SH3 domain-containing protein [Ruminococcaceae bacterium]|nr:SH3 domain-containing protein [Oscillospiraceae bacterium]